MSRPQQPKIEYSTVLNCRYAVVKSEKLKSRSDFEKIYALSPRLCRNLIVPNNIEIPEECGIKRFSADNFKQHLAVSAAIAAIGYSEIPLYRRAVGFVDLDGSCASYVYKLINYFNLVKIVTSNYKRYIKISDELIKTYGAQIIYSNNPDILNRGNEIMMVVAPKEPTPLIKPDVPVFCGSCDFQSNQIISNYKINLSREIIEQCPEKINPFDFAAAVWECSNCQPIENVVPHLCEWKGQQQSLKNIGKSIRKMAGYACE